MPFLRFFQRVEKLSQLSYITTIQLQFCCTMNHFLFLPIFLGGISNHRHREALAVGCRKIPGLGTYPSWPEQVQATENTTDGAPQMVVISKGNGTPYFRKIQVGEIL